MQTSCVYGKLWAVTGDLLVVGWVGMWGRGGQANPFIHFSPPFQAPVLPISLDSSFQHPHHALAQGGPPICRRAEQTQTLLPFAFSTFPGPPQG